MCNIYPAINEQALVCPVCDIETNRLLKNVWVNQAICEACMFIWYDQGVTDPEMIKAIRLMKLGKTT